MRWSGVLAVGCAFALACSNNNGDSDGGSDGSADVLGGDSPNVDGSKDAGGDAMPNPDGATSVCSPSTTYGAGTLIAASTSGSDFFGSITPDELTIAWMTTQGSVLYADRQMASDPFGTAQTLTGAIALDHVSLSADGLTLIVVQDDRYSLTQSTRSARGTAFTATLDKTPFSSLDPPVTEVDGGIGPVHGLFADPMLSPDGQFLYYSQYGQTTLTMLESYRQEGMSTPWPQGRNLLEAPLGAPDVSGTRMRPTGMSTDDLTLFFYDEVAMKERVAFRAGALMNNTYAQFVDLGAYENAAPTSNCQRIYFSNSGNGGLDLFYADKQ
jgi:hypothetical protein